MDGLPENVEAQRQRIVELAREYHVSEISYSDKPAAFLVFAI